MVLFGYPQWIVLIWLFLLGATLGSFLNVCIHRFPHHDRLLDQLRALARVPSHCPRCQRPIRWYDNIPILGWLKLRGRCRSCRGRISIRYPLIELANGLLFVLLYWHEVPAGFRAEPSHSGLYTPLGPTGLAGSVWLSNVAILHWRYVLHLVLIEGLIVATFIDIDHRIIPDGSTVPAMVIGVLGGWLVGRVYLVPVWFQEPSIMAAVQYALEQQQVADWVIALFAPTRVPAWIPEYPHTHGLLVSLAGLVVGGGIVWAVRVIGTRILGQEAMGFGDVVLMAMIGSFIGWQPVVAVFFLAPLCALLVVVGAWVLRRQREIPYGPYLSLATLILLLGWKQFWPMIDRMFGMGVLVPLMAAGLATLFALCLVLVQGVKRLLGVAAHQEEWLERWTSADQLAHFASQTAVLDARGDDTWPGAAAARGTSDYHRWHGGTSSWGG